METYQHTVAYYETDKMGITHHSNYIRWMEESRVHFLSVIGWPFEKLEELGLVSPVMEVNVKYLHSTTFADVVSIHVTISELKMAKMRVSYTMEKEDGTLVAEASSLHAFLHQDGHPARLEKEYPEFWEKLKAHLVPQA